MSKKEHFEKPKNESLAHVPKITQPKSYVPRSKGVLCSPHTQTQTHTKVFGFQICFWYTLKTLYTLHNILFHDMDSAILREIMIMIFT